ncbi:hypothetical protein [Pectobacterium phage Wc4-1]|uniref:Uncharacterized protein n=3 Tax=Arnovirus TaxID=3425109 RepID=A0A5P8D445_9CAUD|nr:hypothetical protein Arno162_131 [Pectobacterium phage Arno162]AZV02318.1 hypothetical protein Arno18_132 [Pectobacterium phage Arno18]QFP93818.1 hypothetical protein [Pectobacterium phage Wc4]QFP93963.1 hypothetical protein [Pectobacterium phage Wc4-1]
MARTIRRKELKGSGGYYDWKNEVRSDPKAAERYVHSDMPYRRGRWNSGNKFLKDQCSQVRRAETRQISQAGEDDFIPHDDMTVKVKANRWYWD